MAGGAAPGGVTSPVDADTGLAPSVRHGEGSVGAMLLRTVDFVLVSRREWGFFNGAWGILKAGDRVPGVAAREAIGEEERRRRDVEERVGC